MYGKGQERTATIPKVVDSMRVRGVVLSGGRWDGISENNMPNDCDVRIWSK